MTDRVHHGLLSPRQRHFFYWSLAVSFVGLILCLSILASESLESENRFSQGTETYVASCTELAYCLPTLVFLVLFCLFGIAYGGFFVVSHVGMSTSSEAFERHLHAVQFVPEQMVLAQEARKKDKRIQKKYATLLSKAQSLLDEDKIKKAERVYDGIMHDYVHLTYDQKQLVHQGINDFYKKLHLAIKKHYAKQHAASMKKNEHLSKTARQPKTQINLSQSDEQKKRNERLLLKGKSSKFLKCWSLIKKSKEALTEGNFQSARDRYKKSREMYLSLNYHEKKDAYTDLHELYVFLTDK